ncbi:MAG: 3-deoxy-manno-octulosonate cytidylyltransferase [Ginsengibacter sp.]
MKTVAMIPARYAATRFPGKLMQIIGDKTIIRHTYENTVATRLFDEVVVVTDSTIIFEEIIHNGGYAIMSRKQHESGSDRIAEAVENMEVDIILNVQGDEPFLNKKSLRELLAVFSGVEGKKVQVASLMKIINETTVINNPDCVKVVVDKNMNSLLFSRSVIPFLRDTKTSTTYYQHIGVYAFRKDALMNFTHWEISPLEAAEKIECLRYLENGIHLKMILTSYNGNAIDTPADLETAKNFYSSL